jgi:hypothetical protein
MSAFCYLLHLWRSKMYEKFRAVVLSKVQSACFLLSWPRWSGRRDI